MQPVRALGGTVATSVYRQSDLPKPAEDRRRPNLSVLGGAGPSDGQPVVIVVESFAYAP